MIKKHFQNLFVLALLATPLSCTQIPIKNTEACAVAGKLQAGADCGNTLSPETREMNFNEFVDWLEPDPKTGRGPAICQSAEDFNSMKTALEQACAAVKNLCTYEMKQKLAQASATLDKLVKTANQKAKKLKPKGLTNENENASRGN